MATYSIYVKTKLGVCHNPELSKQQALLVAAASWGTEVKDQQQAKGRSGTVSEQGCKDQAEISGGLQVS